MSRAMPVNMRRWPRCISLTARCMGKVRAVLAQADLDLAADADDLLLAGLPVICEVAVVLAVVWLGHEHLDVPADDLGDR